MREPGAGPLNDEQTVARIKTGFGCMCRHEWLVDWGDPHCDGPLTRGGGGLCWTCKVVRRCGDRHFETNSYTVIGEPATLIDDIAVWDPEAVINLRRPADPASP